MRRLARVRPLHIGLVCAAWVGLIAFLPQLILLALKLHARVQSLLSPAGYQTRVLYTHWSSERATLLVLAAPPLLLFCAWAWSRLSHRS